VLHTRTAMSVGNETVGAFVPGRGAHTKEFDAQPGRLVRERAVDDVLSASFPASDPPSWNPGTARPDPRGAGVDAVAARPNDIITISTPIRDVTFLRGLISVAAAVAIVLLLPLLILLVGVADRSRSTSTPGSGRLALRGDSGLTPERAVLSTSWTEY
jgi:hypothetical protein